MKHNNIKKTNFYYKFILLYYCILLQQYGKRISGFFLYVIYIIFLVCNIMCYMYKHEISMIHMNYTIQNILSKIKKHVVCSIFKYNKYIIL